MSHEDQRQYRFVDDLQELLVKNDTQQLKDYCSEQHPADLADAIELLEIDEYQAIFKLLDVESAAEVLHHCQEDMHAHLMEALDENALAKVLEELPPDDAADAVAELPEDKAKEILSIMPAEDSEEIQDLLQYDEETAGGIMTPEVIAFRENTTVEEVLRAFRGEWSAESAPPAIVEDWEIANELIQEENVYSIFVVDESDKLTGFVRLQDMIRAKPSTQLTDIVDTGVISVRTDEDQEEVAEMASKYDLASIPVVDHVGRLVGRVTIDDLIDVMEEETTEDIMKMAGTSEDELATMSAFRSLQLRIPWLLGALIGLFLATLILMLFEGKMPGKFAPLAVFVPVIMGISGNTGVQAATIMVRGLATGQVDLTEYFDLLMKELRTGILLGIVCGALIMVVALIFVDQHTAWVVGISALVAMTLASVLGVLIPTMFARLGRDPAIATGPLVTSLSDAAAVLLYLAVAFFLY